MNADEHDEMATPTEAMREFARNYGADHPDRAWVLTDFDVWMPNPHYQGPPVPHPESYEAEHGLPMPAPAPVVDTRPNACKDDSCDACHCPRCGGHKVDWYAVGLCSECQQKEDEIPF
jgi:hypothetical protein